MKERLVHFIVTRFNLPLWNADKNSRSTLDRSWLESRYAMFEKYCYPSVTSQTNKNFIWLCLFDEDTPDEFKQRNEGYRDANFVPCYLSIKGTKSKDIHIEDFLRDKMRSIIGADDCWVVVTRLDNDDALNVCTVDVVQRTFLEIKKRNRQVLNYVNGYQYFEKENFCLDVVFYGSHFFSAIGTLSDGIESIVMMRHAQVEKHFTTTNVRTNDPMWLEVVHKNNVANDARSKWAFSKIIFDANLKKFFALNLNLKKQSRLRLRVMVLWGKIVRRRFSKFVPRVRSIAVSPQ